MQDKPSDYPKVGILKALVIKAIVWDNCEGGFATMAQPGQIIDVTKDDDDTYSAHFVYGDHTVSDYIGVKEAIQIVSDEEAEALDKKYRREMEERLERNRRYREQMEHETDFFDDEEDDDKIDDLIDDL